MTLFYTFRTNRFIEHFTDCGVDLFVFGPLKRDLGRFTELVEQLKPTHIVGLATVNGRSRWETVAANNFNGKNIVASGIGTYELSVPESTQFRLSKRTTSSFCNWTMYKIAELVALKRLKSKVLFLHFNPAEVNNVIDETKGLFESGGSTVADPPPHLVRWHV